MAGAWKGKKEINRAELPEVSELEEALKDARYHSDYRSAIRGIICTLITVTALALLVATLVFPVLQVYGTSMAPAVSEDSFVIAAKNSNPDRGDILAFFYNNKILIRRVIGLPGDVIHIAHNGTVTVNSEELEESYLSSRGYGNCDLEFPYIVPDGTYFVLADDRANGIDSRSSVFGCISEEDFIGTVFWQVWPIRIGALK